MAEARCPALQAQSEPCRWRGRIARESRPCSYAFGPVHDERVGDAAPIGLTLPTAKGRVAGMGPTPGVVVERRGAAQLVDLLQVLLERIRHIVEELVLVHRTGGPALGACAVVGDEHD